jgi:hypothetical protein
VLDNGRRGGQPRAVVDDEIVDDAEVALDRLCPAGYERVFVRPPWDPRERACRRCGKKSIPGAWAVVTVVRIFHELGTVWFSFAAVCGPCGRDARAARELGARIFAANVN